MKAACKTILDGLSEIDQQAINAAIEKRETPDLTAEARAAIALEAVTAHLAAVETQRGDFLTQLGEEPTALPGGPAAPTVLRFSSGMSRPGDFLTALAANHSIGIEIGELSAVSIPKIAKALHESKDARLFVDTGAFTLFRAGLRAKQRGEKFGPLFAGEQPEPLDFPAIFQKFEALALALSKVSEDEGGSAATRVSWVMPDIVGDQAGSIALLREHQEDVRAHQVFGNAIFPIQTGAKTLTEAFDEVAEIVGRKDLIVGIPSNEKAVSAEEFRTFIQDRGDVIQGVHMLGAAADTRMAPRLAILKEEGFDGEISGDANRLRSIMHGDTTRAEAMRRLLGTPTIDDAAAEAATDATDAQKEAENYKMGHDAIAGLDISIETAQGEKRRPEWPTLTAHYGRIKGTKGADGGLVDVFVKPGTPKDFAGKVFVIDQNKADGTFDEHKVMLGWATQEEARAAYLENYEPGWESRVRGLRTFPLAGFKKWVYDPALTVKPATGTAKLPDAEKQPDTPKRQPKGKPTSGDGLSLFDDRGKPTAEAIGVKAKKKTKAELKAEENERLSELDAAKRKKWHDEKLAENTAGLAEARKKAAALRENLDQAPAELRPLYEALYAVVENEKPTEFLQGMDSFDIRYREAGHEDDSPEARKLIAAAAEWGWNAWKAGDKRVLAHIGYNHHSLWIETPAGNINLVKWDGIDQGSADLEFDMGWASNGIRFDQVRGVDFSEVADLFAYRLNHGQRKAEKGIPRGPLNFEQWDPPDPDGYKTDGKPTTIRSARMIDGKPFVIAHNGVMGEQVFKAQALVPVDDYRGQRYATKKDARAAWDDESLDRGSYVGLEVIYQGKPYVIGRDARALMPVKPADTITKAEAEAAFKEFAGLWSGAAKDKKIEAFGSTWVWTEAEEESEEGETSVPRESRKKGLMALRLNGKVYVESVFSGMFDLWERGVPGGPATPTPTVNARDDSKEKAAAAKEREKAIKTATRTAEGDLFKALSGHPDLVSVASATPEEFKAKIEAIAGQWAKEQADGADDVKKEVMGKLVVPPKMLASLKREAVKLAKEKVAAEKAAPKLKNTGEDLRRHWELVKAELKAKNDAEGITAMNRIFAATTRADLFAGILGEGATPGAERYVDTLRDQVRTFKDWAVDEKFGYFQFSDYRSRDERRSANAKIEAFVTGKGYIETRAWRGMGFEIADGKTTADLSVQERLDALTQLADEYLGTMRALIAPLRGMKRVGEVSQMLTEAIWGERTYKEVDGWKAMNEENTTILGRRLKPYVDRSAAYNLPRKLHVGGPSVEHLAANEATIAAKTRKQPMVPPRLERIIREGRPEVRKGDVTPAMLKEKFAFADVGFGTWVKSAEDQALLNAAYDAFSDLADHLGIDPTNIGFKGRLHFTLGALGHGSKAAATFHPNHPGPSGIVQVINLTKTKGDGTVAHEWGHALDHFLSRTPEGRSAVRQLVFALKTKPPDIEMVRQQAIRNLKSPSGWMRGGRKMKLTPMEAAELAVRHYSASQTTTYKRNADAMDPNYWGNDAELLARSWESWVYDAMEGSNNFLVNPWVADGATKQPAYKGTPFPTGEERKAFAEWYKALAHSLDTTGKEITVDRAKWNEIKPKAQDDFLAAVDALKADLGLMYEQLQREQAAEARAALDASIAADRAQQEALAKRLAEVREAAEKAAREAAEAQAREDAARNPVTPEVPTGVLAEDDLEALFDLAAESVTAENRENVTAPDPGAPALHDEPITTVPKDEAWDAADVREILAMVKAGKKVLFSGAGHEFGLPTIQSVPGAQHLGMGVFKASGTSGTQAWEITFDGGGGMQRTASGIAYTVIGDSDGNYPYNRAGVEIALEKMLPKVSAEPSGKASAKPSDRTASDLIADAAKLGVTGIDEALTGLAKLFGAGKIQSFPGGFDEDSYREAKPHFEAALKGFQEAGRTLLEFFKMLIERYGLGVKPYAVRFAADMKLTANLGEQPRGSLAVARWVKEQLHRPGADAAISSPALFEKANTAFGGTQAEGKYTPKDAYDAAEAGMNLWILERAGKAGLPIDTNAAGARAAIATLKDITNRLPTATKRTAEQQEFQQFSTVPALAYMANWAANVQEGELMGEPSAGIGGLAVFAKALGARVVANELSSRRAEVLRQVLPDAQVFQEKGEQIANVLPEGIRPTVIVMNPPFSATAGRMEGSRDTMEGAAHIESALQWLKPGGRLVAIVGKGMADGEPRFAPWWKKIKETNNVRAILSLNGAEYAKYGTTYDNVLFVIDKTGPQNGPVVTGRVEAYNELPALLEGVRNDRNQPLAADRAPEQPAAEPGSGEAPPVGVGRPEPQRPESGDVGDGQRNPPGTGGAGVDVGSGRPGSRNGVGDGKPGGGRGAGPGRAGQPDRGGSGQPDSGVDQRPNDGGLTLEVATAARRDEITDSVYEDYEPRKAKVKGAKPHPSKLVESAAMAAVEPIDATYTPNLPQEVIETGRLSAAQIEPVIYAGQAHQEFLPPVMVNGQPVSFRRGYFIGDGTGVGKGREIAGIILDNQRQGRKKHIWLSASGGLVNDARRDYGGVLHGYTPEEALKNVKEIFSLRKVAEGGADPGGAVTRKDGIMFLTYDVLKGGEKAQGGKAKPSAVKKGAKVEVTSGQEGLTFIEIDHAGFVRAKGPYGVRRFPDTSVVSIAGIADWKGEIARAAAEAQSAAAGKASAQTSLKQIMEWVGPDFDGVIAFDEAHKIKNMGGQKGERGVVDGAQRAIAAAELRVMLPKARIVYVSATGATEVANLSYTDRLGLWGEGTSFTSAADFIAKIAAAGLATMELVARDMKAMGVYIARSLSYDGVEQTEIDATFTPLQRQIYDELAEAWQIILKNMNSALETTKQGKNGDAKNNALNAFWSAQQRFFNQVITAMMTPHVLDRAQKAIADGMAVVIQLVNTNEAAQNRIVEAAEAEGKALEELDFSPKEGLIAYLKKAFPVVQFEEYTDDNGKKQSRPVMDAQGEPVLNRELVAKRDALIKHIEDNLRVPDNPMDLIYEAFGEKMVGEVSGRGRRYQKVVKKDGSFTVELRKREGNSNISDSKAFLDDKKRVLIFTDAGGTGYSFHSDKGVKNQRRRFHIPLQTGWVAENMVQGLGRSHRSNQVNAPLVGLPRSDLKAQKRFISSIARRLDQLGALTSGQRNTAGRGLFTARDNLESKYALAALRSLIEDMAPSTRRGGVEVVPNAAQLIAAMGLDDIYDPLTGTIQESKMPKINRFLNRLLSLTIKQQDAVFGEFEQRMDAAIDAAMTNGTYDDGMQTLRALKVTKLRDEVVHTDKRSGADTRYLELELTTATTLNTFARALEEVDNQAPRSNQFYFDNQTGQPFVVVNMGERVGADGRLQYRGLRYDIRASGQASRGHMIMNRDSYERGGDVGRRIRDASGRLVTAPSYRSPSLDAEQGVGTVSRYRKIRLDEAEYLWSEAHAAAPTTETNTVHMLTGALLPIWNRIESDLGDTKTKAVVRTQTDDGERLIGRLIPEDDRAEVLKKLGVGAIDPNMTAETIIARIMAGDQAVLANGWTVKKVRVANDVRMEITGSYLSPSDRKQLVSQGAIEEIISYKERYFIPTGNVPVFERITREASRPVIEFISQKGPDETQFSDAVRPTPATERAKGIPLKSLRDAITRELGGQALPDDAFVARGVPDGLAPALAAIEKAWGIKVVAFHNNVPDLIDFNGVHVGDNTLYVNVNAQYPLLQVVGHELLHEMRKRAPQLYEGLAARVGPLLKNADRYRVERIAPKHRGMPDANLMEEMIADLVGDNFTKPQFWRELAGQDPTVLDRLAQWVINFLNRAVQAVKGLYQVDRFVTDVTAARDAVAKAMAEFAVANTAGADSDLQFSDKAQPWYSELERQVIASKTESAPAAQWIGTIKSMKGVKADEIEWSGVLEWLESHVLSDSEKAAAAQNPRAFDGKISKWDIQRFLADKGVKVEEVMLGGESVKKAQEEYRAQAQHALMNEYQAYLRENPELQPLGDAEEALSFVRRHRERDDISEADNARLSAQAHFLDGFTRRWEAMESGTGVTDLIRVRLDSMGYDFSADDFENRALELVHRATGAVYGAHDHGEINDPEVGVKPFSDLPDDVQGLIEDYDQAAANGDDIFDDEDGTRNGGARYASYTLPGGKDYRELLLTLPVPADNQVYIGDEAEARRIAASRRDAVVARVGENWVVRAPNYNSNGPNGEPTPWSARFHSSHFDTPNILAHVRFNERTDADGKRVLFIEEIQSDWAQKGKREGFGPRPDMRVVVYQLKGPDGRMVAQFNSRAEADAAMAQRRGADLEIVEREFSHSPGAIPPAPFVGKTEAWVALAVKRIIRYAAENGFERVATVTGEQSADRYSLRHQVDKIEWTTMIGTTNTRVSIGTTRGLVRFIVSKDAVIETNIANAGPMEGKKLDEVVGKAAAEKIMGTTHGTLEGEGLNIGGEGMIQFYDKIVPNVVNDVLKKLGGGRVTEVKIDIPTVKTRGGLTLPTSDRVTQPSFDITPALRDRAMQGMPLFQDMVRGAEFQRNAINAFNDLTRSTKQFNWWDRTVGTQLHKASKNPWFRRVFERGQRYLQDVNEFATRAMDEAPNILLKLENLRDVVKLGAKPEELNAIAAVIFNETLGNERLDAEALRAALPDDRVRGFYREARRAINRSLDDMAATEWVRKTRNMGLEQAHQAVKDNLENAEAILLVAIDQKLAELRLRWRETDVDEARKSIETTAAGYKQVRGEIYTSARRVEQLKAQGYAPLMRFGKYSVHAWHDSDTGSRVSDGFFMFENERDANAARRELAEAFPESTVEQGIMSQDAWKVFQGVSPDTLEVFAKALGVEENAVFQEYLKFAVNNRSALKRLIKRKGIAGFSTDLSRVLASFVTSNARRASGNLHFADMLHEVESIPKSEGDVKDEAIHLVEYLQNPREEAAGFRSFLFAQFLGGSVAAAMVNMTQPLLMTFPYLQQYGATPAMMLRAAKIAMTGPTEGALVGAMAKAASDGVIAPNEIHQLYAESIRSLGSNIWVRRFMRAWGSLFAVSEGYNRRLTFAAAYEAATARGMTDPYAFAVRAVEETQGIYNRGNRPNWARGAIGATIFTFKQFSVAYLEFLVRLPRPQQALALGVLILAAGIQGLPFADDLDDLIDTIGQSMGYNTNAKRWKRTALAEAIGEGPGNFVLQGISALPGMPLDVQARLGVGNLIPGSSALKRSEVDKGRDVLEFLGPAGGVVQSAAKALGKLQAGSPGGAAAEVAPVAVKNALKALQMADMGVYQDTRGRKVIEVDGYDSAIKAIGFQPSSVAQESRRAQEVRQSVAMNKVVEGNIAEEWARGIFERDPEKVAKARAELIDWNTKNPESRIRIVPEQIHRRVMEMMKTREQRMTKSAPREIRADVKRELQRN